jgi:translation elongation factor EF-Ts
LLDSGDESLNGSVEEIAKTLAMHAAAMKPSYMTKDEIQQDVIN